MQHSNIVGGSTAKRVMACPGSVKLVQQMPPKPSSKYADEGTLCHNTIADILDKSLSPEATIGFKYQDHTMTTDLLDTKIRPALEFLDVIDPDKQMEFAVESRVGFGDVLPDVFGSTDFLGRIGDTAIVLDWKFGDGVMVDAEENAQLMFYAAASMRTEATKWVFDGVKEILCIIVQPPGARQWRTTPERIAQFERDLVRAVKAAERDNATLSAGEHCRWCAAKPVCPQMTGAVDRALIAQLAALDTEMIGRYLANADVLEQWIADLRALAHRMLENSVAVPGYKLVAKRASRQWKDEDAAVAALAAILPDDVLYNKKLITPPQAEKALKAIKQELPGELVTAVSSGSTLAPESDPRPAFLQIGQQLRSALSKL